MHYLVLDHTFRLMRCLCKQVWRD